MAAEQVATQVIETPDDTGWEDNDYVTFETGAGPFGRRAVARSRLGKVRQALVDFRQAEAVREKHRRILPLGGYHRAQHILLLARLGRLQAARALLQECDLEAARTLRPLLAAQYELARAEVEFQRDNVSAAIHEAEEAVRIREAIGDPKLGNTHSLLDRAQRGADWSSNI